MTTNNSKYYPRNLDKLVGQYKNTYDHTINKNPINTDCSALTEKIETNLKIGQVILAIDFVLKTNPWTYKIKDLNGEK